eukprot:augustus_masked-scaffold_5-processed-gene-2.2-mRNA-1 protein AED:0.46 eAED:0.46 QI:0/0/0/0.5/1/1/2/0/889
MVHLELQLTAIENGNDPLEGIAVRKNNAILTSLLINRISDNVLLRIHGIEAAGNIWLRLKEMFALTDRAQRQIAKDRYVNPTGATLTDKLHDFEVNVRSYEQAGGRIDEEEKIERAIKIINTQEAKLLQIAVDSQPELFTFDKILRRLHILANKIHRSRITQNQRGSQSARNATNTSARKKGLQCHHCKRFGHVKAQCRNLKCSNCNGFGHFTKDCRVKTEKQANLANRSNTDDEDLLNMNEGQSQVTSSTKTTTYLKELQGFMVDMNRKNEKEKQKLNNNEKTKQKEDKNGKTKQKEHNKKENKKIHRLIFDSGASEHIAPTSLEKYMSNITTIENTKVAGINTSVNTNKKGTLKIKIDDKILKLNEVNKLPRSFREAMNSEKKNSWLSAYKKELEKFINIAKCKFIHKNNIPQNTRIYNFIEIFTKKYDNIKKKPVYKVRFAADGSQAPPLEPVYSPVSNKESVRIFLAHASACSHRIYQVDITNAYLNASLDNQRFYNLPQIYRSKRKSYVWVSDRAVYGLKESGRKWFLHISASLISFGFTTSDVEMTLFKRRNEDGEYDFILIYVDDILISVKKDYNAHKILRELQSVYDIKSTDKAQNFIGFEIIDNSNTKFISLQNYITKSADLFDLERSKTIETPHQPGVYVLQEDNTINPTLYQRIVGILHFICEMVRPDISFIVNRLAVFTKKPAIEHLRAAKRVLKYLLGTKEYGIHYKKNKKIFEMYIFSDASWKNVTGDLSSLDGHIILLNGGPICWKSKKQKNISKSSTEAEVVGLTRALSTAEWVKNLLTFLEVDKLKVRIFTDSLSTIKLLQGQTLSEKSRHMGVNFFFTRKIIKKNEWQLSHISGLQNPADLFTKPVSKISYLKLRNYLVKKNVSNGRRETG